MSKRKLSGASDTGKTAKPRVDPPDNTPKTIDENFIHLAFSESGLDTYSEKFKFGTLKPTIGFYGFIQALLNNAINKPTLIAYIYGECFANPLSNYLDRNGDDLTPMGDVGWTAAWVRIRDEEFVGIRYLVRVFIMTITSKVLLPIRYSRSGPREEGGDKAERSGQFRQQLHDRDNSLCVITQVLSDSAPGDPGHGLTKGPLEAAHIIPHHLSAGTKADVRNTIRAFAGPGSLPDFENKYDHVSNGILMELNCHKTFDKLQWSIEATPIIGGYQYHIRRTRPNGKAPDAGLATALLADGTQLVFGGDATTNPNPHYCNLHLAVARISYAVGLADVFDELDRDKDGFDGVAWDQAGAEGAANDLKLMKERELMKGREGAKIDEEPTPIPSQVPSGRVSPSPGAKSKRDLSPQRGGKAGSQVVISKTGRTTPENKVLSTAEMLGQQDSSWNPGAGDVLPDTGNKEQQAF